MLCSIDGRVLRPVASLHWFSDHLGWERLREISAGRRVCCVKTRMDETGDVNRMRGEIEGCGHALLSDLPVVSG